ncbi:MAG TPA: phage holin family protein [Candidatus Dormibacteraeota bacterium]|jgi:hypothetical protein|nr:phage holin family protein [Candidatus Dormibacteraeota bacterium]
MTDVGKPPATELRGRPASSDDERQKPIAELLRELADETSALVRQELALAKAELAEKGKQVGIGVGMFGGAGVVALAALGAFTAFLIAVLALALPVWGAALVVTAVYGVVAGILAMTGRNRLKRGTPPVPEETVETVKEDVAWAKTRAQSGRR